MHRSTLTFENPRAPKALRPSDPPTGVHWTRAEAGQRELIRLEGMKIAQTAVQSIGMDTQDRWGPPKRLPEYALTISLLFTKATNQTIILGTPPKHVLSTSILRSSLAHDKRFEQVPMNEAAPGDIVIGSGWQQGGDGYAGIVVDHGRIVSNSGQGVQDNSSLSEIQRSHPGTVLFRYIGFRKFYPGKPLANAGFNADEPRLPAGQPGGGQWTSGMAPSTVALSGKNSRISSVTATKSGEPDRSHDNSAGNPGVLIYTNDKDTYNRYTTTQSKHGQLASAKVIYVGSPDSPNNAFLATDNPVNVSPGANNVTYGNRVTINPGESWYYYSPEDAQKIQKSGKVH